MKSPKYIFSLFLACNFIIRLYIFITAIYSLKTQGAKLENGQDNNQSAIALILIPFLWFIEIIGFIVPRPDACFATSLIVFSDIVGFHIGLTQNFDLWIPFGFALPFSILALITHCYIIKQEYALHEKRRMYQSIWFIENKQIKISESL